MTWESVFPAAKHTFLPCNMGQGETPPSLYQRRVRECRRARGHLRHRRIDLVNARNFARGDRNIFAWGYTIRWTLLVSCMRDDHSTHVSPTPCPPQRASFQNLRHFPREVSKSKHTNHLRRATIEVAVFVWRKYFQNDAAP